MKGRKPKLKIAAAGNSERPTRKKPRTPTAPSCLSKIAKQEWRRVVARLQARNLLADEKLSTLHTYCVQVGVMRMLESQMDEEGWTIDTEKGPIPHPATRVYNNAMREARLLAAELSLTRQGASGKEESTKDDGWEGLIA